MSNLQVGFKLPYNAIENLRALIQREHRRILMEIDAAQSLSEGQKRHALHELGRLRLQVENLARLFDIELQDALS